MLTFGDAMSLLLTFFVMLMTFSTFNTNKLLNAMGGIQGALGSREPVVLKFSKLSTTPEAPVPDEAGKIITQIQAELVAPGQLSPVNLRDVAIYNRFNEFRQRIEGLGFARHITIAEVDEGIIMKLDCSIIFADKNSAKTNKVFLQAIEGFANVAYDIGNEVRITSNYTVPTNFSEISAEKASERLASQRAAVVGATLISKYKIAPDRLGYSTEVITDKSENNIQLELVEKFGIREVSVEDLVKIH